MAAHVRQSSLRVRGHIRPRDGGPRMHSPERLNAALSLPSTSTHIPSTPPKPSLSEFRTSYFFDGPNSSNETSSPSPMARVTAPPSPAHHNEKEATRTLFDGPSRPRYIIPLAELYLGEIKSGKTKSLSRAAESSSLEDSNVKLVGKV
ncbi:hypothetical protein NEOLEDRAFT_1129690, partial [Neolentinus lepideus HHB14362 ss-1]